MTPHGRGGITHLDDAPAQRVDEYGKRARFTQLGLHSIDVGLRRIELEPGCQPTPPHAHAASEEIFYVLGGGGLSWQDGRTFAVRAGDCLVHRAGAEAHTLLGGDDGLDVLAFGERKRAELGWLPRADVGWLGATWVATGGEHPWAQDEAAGPLEWPDPSPQRPPGIVHRAEVDEESDGEGGSAFAVRDLGRAAGSRTTGLRLVAIAPGKLGYPPHCHASEEELLVVLEGHGTLLLYPLDGPPEELAVRAGHVVSRPPGTGVAHAFRAGPRGLTHLAYGTRVPDDVAYFPRSRKLYLRGVGVITRVERLAYWDGEG